MGLFLGHSMTPIDRLRRKLQAHPPSTGLRCFLRHPEPEDRLIEAAVLVGLVDQADGWHLLLTRRSDTVRDHAGQVCFVGGSLEPGETPLEAALREAEEEISLPGRCVDVVGQLDRHLIANRFLVTPFVAVIAPFAAKIDPAEVASLFTVPLDFFLDDLNRLPDQRFNGYHGFKFLFPVPELGQQEIWGGTASMILNLKDVLHAG